MNSWLVLWIFAASAFGISTAWTQSTSGNCSPIVANVHGNVTITCTMVANRIPVYKFEGEITRANVGQFGQFVEAHADDIIELNIWPNSFEAVGVNSLYDVEERDGKMFFSLNSPSNPRSPGEGGMIYNIISKNVTWANGGYVIRGFYSGQSIPGIHQGWMEFALEEIPRGELLSRGRVDRR